MIPTRRLAYNSQIKMANDHERPLLLYPVNKAADWVDDHPVVSRRTVLGLLLSAWGLWAFDRVKFVLEATNTWEKLWLLGAQYEEPKIREEEIKTVGNVRTINTSSYYEIVPVLPNVSLSPLGPNTFSEQAQNAPFLYNFVFLDNGKSQYAEEIKNEANPFYLRENESQQSYVFTVFMQTLDENFFHLSQEEQKNSLRSTEAYANADIYAIFRFVAEHENNLDNVTNEVWDQTLEGYRSYFYNLEDDKRPTFVRVSLPFNHDANNH